MREEVLKGKTLGTSEHKADNNNNKNSSKEDKVNDKKKRLSVEWWDKAMKRLQEENIQEENIYIYNQYLQTKKGYEKLRRIPKN